MRQPAHNQLVAAQQLHPVDAQIHAFFFWPARNDQWPGHQWADIPRPTGLDRELGEVDIVTADHLLLAGGLFDDIGSHGQDFFQQRRLVHEIPKAFGRIGLAQVGQQFADIAQGLDIFFPHAERNTPLRAEQVGKNGNIGAFGVFE